MTENFDLDRLVEAALAEPEEFLARFGQIADTLDDWQAGWVRGLALRETGRLREAEAAMGQAVDAILEIDPVAAARVRSSRSILFLSLGDTDAALADADWAAQHLIDGDAGRNESQRGIILFRLGRHLEGLDACARALPLLEQAGDLKALGRLHGNIGVTHSVLGNVESAREHLAEAARLARETDSPLAAGIAEHNLGFLEGRAGDVPAALAHFDAAEELLRDLVGPGRKAVATIDRAEVLADAGLLEDALAHVEQSIAALSEAEERIVLAEARLLAARVHGALGQFAEAARQAAEARLELERLQRFGWAVKARWVELSAARDAGRGLDAHAVATLATELAEAGWQFESLDALLVAVDLALGSGHAALARQLVGRLRRSPRDVPALLQIGRHRAVARTRLASGDRRGARRAITDALKLLHEHRLSHGSAELRAHASRHGQGLFAVAIELALEDDRPDDALVALDLLRDTDRPVWSRPPDDPELAAELERLRRLDAELREASREGADDRGLGRERARAERRIRDGLRRRAGATGTGERLDVAELVRALEGRHLCSWFVHEGQLGSIKVSAEGRRLRMLGPVDELVREIDAWRFALRRLAEGRGSGRRLEDAARSARAAADQLVSLLDLAEHPIGQDLVVVPTGVLRGLAWHCLHVLEGATVSVVPSAAYWLSQSTSAPAGGAVLAAAGPSLAAAQREVDQVASQHEDGRVLAGELATANAVIESLDGVAIGHLAAHGAFRWDNPLFSSLEFSDGPMWLHDFERLSSPPGTLVLSSCDMAMDRVVAGDAVVGMASGLLRLGVRTLIAPVVPVPDEETADFMVALHERMAAGASGGEALAAIAATWSGETPRQQAVKQSFVSFGA